MRFIRVVDETSAEINTQRRIPFEIDAQFFFVETRKQTFRCLCAALSERGMRSRIDDDIHVINASFAQAIQGIFKRIKKRGRKHRSIFLLDQFGYKDVPFPLLNKIFSELPNAEVLLTFATDHLLNFRSEGKVYRDIVERLGLSAALGVDPSRLSSENKLSRFILEQKLAGEIHHQSGAGYFTPFFIRPSKSSRSYWLIHLSNHPRARDEMCRIHWGLHNHFEHNGRAGLWMLGFDPRYSDFDQGMLGFRFDEVARDKTLRSLMDDLPKVPLLREGTSFDNLMARIVNETPATSELVRQSLLKLQDHGDIEVVTRNQRHRRSASGIRGTDIVRLHRQSRFDFGST